MGLMCSEHSAIGDQSAAILRDARDTSAVLPSAESLPLGACNHASNAGRH